MKMTYEELEAAYLELCVNVERDAKRIVGTCGAGFTDRAGIAAVALCDYAAISKNQYLMRKEVARGYDLSALTINAKDCSPE